MLRSIGHDQYVMWEIAKAAWTTRLLLGFSSKVRKCIEKKTGKEYAAKIVELKNKPSNGCHRYNTHESTMEEVRILRILTGHPNIIEFYDVFVSHSYIFLVFEMCKKGDLRDYLISAVKLSEEKTRNIMRQIFECLQYIHSKDIIHKDLQLENILFDDNSNIKIADFGYAKLCKPGEKIHGPFGTLEYSVPEVVKYKAMYDRAEGGFEFDLWACGIMMFILLSGHTLFLDRDKMNVIRHLIGGQWSSGYDKWRGITASSKDLIKKLLDREPRNRISVQEALNHPFFHTSPGYRYNAFRMYGH